jgi:hypothetical protein
MKGNGDTARTAPTFAPQTPKPEAGSMAASIIHAMHLPEESAHMELTERLERIQALWAGVPAQLQPSNVLAQSALAARVLRDAGQQLAVKTERYPVHVATAQLPLLPEPLRLKCGPLLVTLQWWGGGVVKADLPCCALFGEGETDTAALEDLGVTMLDWASGIVALGGRDRLGGALLRQWDAFVALVDVSGL